MSQRDNRGMRATATSDRPEGEPTRSERKSTAEWSKEVIDEVLDTRELGQRGEIWLGLQVAVFGLALIGPSGLQGLTDSLGLLIALLGLAQGVLGSINLGENLTPLPKPREQHELVTSGMYEYVRHPLYGCLIMIAGGVGVYTESSVRLLLTLLLILVLEKKAIVEEEYLVKRYPEYENYRERTKKFIPYLY